MASIVFWSTFGYIVGYLIGVGRVLKDWRAERSNEEIRR